MATRKSGPRPMNATAAQSPTAPQALVSSVPGDEPATIPEPAPAAESARPTKPLTKSLTTVKTTLLLPGPTDHELNQLAQATADELGRIAGGRGGRFPGRSDVLKAMIGMVADDLELRDRMIGRVHRDITERRA